MLWLLCQERQDLRTEVCSSLLFLDHPDRRVTLQANESIHKALLTL